MQQDVQRKGTFNTKIKGLSELDDDDFALESEVIEIRGIRWRFEVYKKNNRYCFGFFLEEDRYIAAEADIKVRIISKKAAVEDIQKSQVSFQNPFFTGDWTRQKFYEADVDKISDFVENDTIDFEVSIDIKRVACIPGWEIDYFEKPTKMSDAVLHVDSIIHVNKMFLSIHSSYFEKLFSNSGTEEEFDLNDEDLFEIVELLRYIYVSDSLLIDEWHAAEVLRIVEHFDFPHIFHVFANHLMKQKKIIQKCYLFKIADTFKSAELQNHLLKLMTKEDMRVLLTKDWFKGISANAKNALAERIEKWDSPTDAEKVLIPETNCNVVDFSKPTKLWDVILVVEGKKIHVNKTLLAMYSPVFEAMFFTGFKEQNQSEIELKELEYDAFIDLLTLIYPQSGYRIREDNLEDILELADRFDIRMAIHLCEEYLIWTEEIENMKKLQIAEKWVLKECQRRLLKSWKREDIKNLIACEGFQDLKIETIKSIIDRSLDMPCM